EGAKTLLGGVEEASADAAGAIAQQHLQEQVALLVGAELLLRHQVDFVDVLPVGQKLDTAAAHAHSLCPETPWLIRMPTQSRGHGTQFITLHQGCHGHGLAWPCSNHAASWLLSFYRANAAMTGDEAKAIAGDPQVELLAQRRNARNVQ